MRRTFLLYKEKFYITGSQSMKFKKSFFALLICVLVLPLIFKTLTVSAEDVTNSKITMKYYNGSAWIDFNKTAETEQITGIRLTTKSNDYYLKYETQNEGVGKFYSSVKSNDLSETAYAGTGHKESNQRSVQLIRINAYRSSDNHIINSEIVVMYRVKSNGKWLPWVSNANSKIRENIKNKYLVNDEVDLVSTYSGILNYNITGIEIRLFEEYDNSFNEITLSGNEYKPQMEYTVDNSTFNSFEVSTAIEESVSAIKITTDTDKPYYLSYCVRAQGTSGYYSTVDTTEDDYAGVIGKPIQTLKINAYAKGQITPIKEKIVVMYRVYTTKWLPWVSNADPEWMQSVKLKYKIAGSLDTKSGYAGVVGTNIKAVEIRVFEENEIMTSCANQNSKIIEVPYINQIESGFPTGCESASTVMAINHSGINITVDEFVDNYLDKDQNTHNFNPNTHFGGNPRNNSGMGCYAPVIMNALDKILENDTHYAKNVSDTPLSQLCSEYLDNGIPVIVWATMDMNEGSIVNYDEGLIWRAPEHCLLLVGYDDYCYIFHDPLRNKYIHYLKADVETAYEFMLSQSIVILNDPQQTILNSDGLIVKKIDSDGNLTSYVYDENNILIKSVNGKNADVNCDGKEDIRDFVTIKNVATYSIEDILKSCDLNSDNITNGEDVTILIKFLLGSCFYENNLIH